MFTLFRFMKVFKLPPPEREGDHVWYYSYGSNMKSEVFCQRRGIVAQETVRCPRAPRRFRSVSEGPSTPVARFVRFCPSCYVGPLQYDVLRPYYM